MAGDSGCQHDGLSVMSAVSTPAHVANPTEPVKLRVTDDGPAEPPASDPDEPHAKRKRPTEAESPVHDSDFEAWCEHIDSGVDSDSQGWCDSDDVSEFEEWCVPPEPMEDNLFTRVLEIDEQICRVIPVENPDEVWWVVGNSRMLMKRKARPDADNLHPNEKPDPTMVDGGPESHPRLPAQPFVSAAPTVR